MIPIVNAELRALVAAGRRLHPARRAQLRLPSRRRPRRSSTSSPARSRACTPISACTCASETTAPGRSAIGRIGRCSRTSAGRRVNQLALEFASREMAEVELLAQLPETMDVAVGLVDVKNTWIEPARAGRRAAADRAQVRRRRRGSRSRPTAAFRRPPGTSRSPRPGRWSKGSGWFAKSSSDDRAGPPGRRADRRDRRRRAPRPGSLAVWWLGQSGFLIKSRAGLLAIDLYLSEHLTQKYEATDRPHVRMTRAPIRGDELRGVDLVLASHKHSDHLDPGTLPGLLAASPRAVLVLPEAILEHALRARDCRADRLVGLDAGEQRSSAPGFRVRAIPSAHEGLDTDAGGASSLPGVRDRVGRAAGSIIAATAWRTTGWPSSSAPIRSTSCFCRSTAATRRGACRETCRRPRPSTWRPAVRPAVRRAASLRHVYVQHGSRRRCSRPRPAGCPRGSRLGSCGAASAGRSRREHHAGNRHRDVRDQDAGDRRAGDDPGLGVGRVSLRPSAAGLVRAGSGALVGGDDEDGRAGPGLGAGSSRRTSPGSA